METARLWRSLGHHDVEGCFRIDGVTGPDEYSAIADNNVYTNLLAQQNLRAAAEAVARHLQGTKARARADDIGDQLIDAGVFTAAPHPRNITQGQADQPVPDAQAHRGE